MASQQSSRYGLFEPHVSADRFLALPRRKPSYVLLRIVRESLYVESIK